MIDRSMSMTSSNSPYTQFTSVVCVFVLLMFYAGSFLVCSFRYYYSVIIALIQISSSDFDVCDITPDIFVN